MENEMETAIYIYICIYRVILIEDLPSPAITQEIIDAAHFQSCPVAALTKACFLKPESPKYAEQLPFLTDFGALRLFFYLLLSPGNPFFCPKN